MGETERQTPTRRDTLRLKVGPPGATGLRPVLVAALALLVGLPVRPLRNNSGSKTILEVLLLGSLTLGETVGRASSSVEEKEAWKDDADEVRAEIEAERAQLDVLPALFGLRVRGESRVTFRLEVRHLRGK